MTAATHPAPARTAPRPDLRSLRTRARLWPALAYSALAAAIAGPLLAPGLVLSVDLAQTPRAPLSSAYWGLPVGTNEGSLGRLPVDALFSLAGSVGLVELAQKLLLLAIPLVAGLGMHRVAPVRAPSARLFAGMLYAANPFVYDRLVNGQWLLLLGYALIPWCFAAFLKVLDGEPGASWRFAVLAGLAGIAGAHMAALVALLCLLTALLAADGKRRAAGALALAAAASLLWVIPTPGLRELWSHVGDNQLQLYGTTSDGTWGPVTTVLAMRGFWNDARPGGGFPLWPAVAALLLLLSGRGLGIARERRVAVAVALAGALGALLALGMASSVTRQPTVFLMDHVPPLRSFRDTQKGVALLVFAYAFLGALAIEELVAAQRRRIAATGLAAAAVALPLVYGAGLFGGAGGELHSVHFPSSWHAADQILKRDAATSRTLFLPFHGYLHLGFARSRVTYNPAPGYFSTPILASRAVTTNPALNDTDDAQELALRPLLANPTAPAVGRCLAALGVSHVLLAHEADWRSVAAIASRPDMRVVGRWPELTLLALRAPGAAAMTAPAAEGGPCPAGIRPLPSRWDSRVHLHLQAPVPPGRRLLLGVPEPQRWSRAGADITFTRWPAYRRIYVAGIAGWLVVLGVAGFSVARARRRPRGLQMSDRRTD